MPKMLEDIAEYYWYLWTLRCGYSSVILKIKGHYLYFILSLMVMLFAIGKPIFAADYPSKPIHIYIPYPVGGAAYKLSETISNEIQIIWQQKVVIHTNQTRQKPVEYIKKMAQLPKDGYHLIVGNLGTHGSAPTFEGIRLGYEPLEDFIPVVMLGQTPMYVLVRQNLCFKYKDDVCKVYVKDLNQLQHYMLKNKKNVTMGHSGEGSTGYLAALHFNALAKTDPTLIRYSGSVLALKDLSNGFLDILIDQSTSALPYISANTVLPLAYTWTESTVASVTPNIPTFKDNIGWQEFDIRGWNILFTPTGTPKNIVFKVNNVVRQALKNPDVREEIALSNTFVMEDSKNQPSILKEFIQSQMEYWQEIIGK